MKIMSRRNGGDSVNNESVAQFIYLPVIVSMKKRKGIHIF